MSWRTPGQKEYTPCKGIKTELLQLQHDSSVIYLIYFRKERKFKNLIGLHSVRQLKKKTKNRKGGEEN